MASSTYSIGFSCFSLTNKTFGRQTLRASILKRNASLVLLVNCLRQRVAVWAWKLAVCQQPTCRDSCRRWTFTCQSAFVHAHLTSNRPHSQTCCQKRPRVNGHAYLALPRTFSGGDKYLPRCRWSRWSIFSFQSPNTTNGVLASP